MSEIYEELIEKWTFHLVNCHGDELTMEDLHQEQEILEDFLNHNPFNPRIRHQIRCPMGDCKWVQHFSIQYQVNLEAYPGEEQ